MPSPRRRRGRRGYLGIPSPHRRSRRSSIGLPSPHAPASYHDEDPDEIDAFNGRPTIYRLNHHYDDHDDASTSDIGDIYSDDSDEEHPWTCDVRTSRDGRSAENCDGKGACARRKAENDDVMKDNNDMNGDQQERTTAENDDDMKGDQRARTTAENDDDMNGDQRARTTAENDDDMNGDQRARTTAENYDDMKDDDDMNGDQRSRTTAENDDVMYSDQRARTTENDDDMKDDDDMNGDQRARTTTENEDTNQAKKAIKCCDDDAEIDRRPNTTTESCDMSVIAAPEICFDVNPHDQSVKTTTANNTGFDKDLHQNLEETHLDQLTPVIQYRVNNGLISI